LAVTRNVFASTALQQLTRASASGVFCRRGAWSKSTAGLIALTKPGPVPTLGPLKNGCARDVTLSSDTVNLVRQHKRAQAELKMANRTTSRDHGLVFAKEYGDLTNRADMSGLPLPGESPGTTAIRTAGENREGQIDHVPRHATHVRSSKPGNPCTSSQSGSAMRVSRSRLTYAHVLPDMQKQAARDHRRAAARGSGLANY
jgi:hypothetical protein